MAGSVRRGPVKVTDAEGQGLGAAFEVGPHRRAEQPELILLGGLDAGDRAGGEHVGPEVQRGPSAVGRDPGAVFVMGDVSGVGLPIAETEIRPVQVFFSIRDSSFLML